MDELFGLSMNIIAAVSVALTLGIFVILAWFAFRNPVMFKQGLRNIPRRKTQTALIIFGLMLATVIMTAAFSTGDTVANTATNDIYDLLGEIDEYIQWDAESNPAPEDQRVIPESELQRLSGEFADDPDIEGFMGLSFENLPVVSPRTNLNESNALISAYDPAESGLFTDGIKVLAGEFRLGGNAIIINEDLAEALDARIGDTLELVFEGERVAVVVSGIAEKSPMTGAFDIGSADQPGGAIAVDFFREVTGRSDSLDIIIVSNTGDARGGLDRSSVVEDKLTPALEGTPYELVTLKDDGIRFVKLASSFFTTFFVVFGLFSIAAGVLLIFLIFIMLAAERKPEMGMARAIGARRRHLVESFLAEGMGYDLGSAIIGVIAGIGVTYAMVAIVNSTGDSGLGLNLRVSFTLRGLLVSFCIGVIATFLIITVASVRASRLNIVSAIRDLPETKPINPEQATWFGYLRGLLNVMAAFGFILLFFVLSFRVSPIFQLLMLVGLVGPFIYVLRGTNFYLPREERLANGRVPLWPFFTIIGIPFYLLALLVVRLTRDRRPSSAPLWLMVVAILVPPVGIVVAALQDRERPIAWGAGMGAFGAILGVVLIQWGLDSDGAFFFSAGVSLVLLWAGTLLRHFRIAERASMTTVSALVLVYWYSPSSWWEPLIGELNGDFEMFFLSGITMVAAGTFIITYNLDILVPIAARLGSRAGRLVPAIKTAAAYPLMARVRTGLTIAMIGLIMFALITFSTINENFVQLFLGDDADGGWDVQVFTNDNNQVDDLAASLDAAGVDTSPIVAAAEARWTGFGEVEFKDPNFDPDKDDPEDEYLGYPLLGADTTWLETNTFSIKFRAAGYATDEDVWQAIAANQRLVVIDQQVALGGGDGFGPSSLFTVDRELTEGFEPFTITMRDPGTGADTELTVIGQVDDSSALFFSAIITSLDTLESIYPDASTQAWYVKLDGGTDSRAYALTIESALFQASAESFDKLIDDQQAASAGFLLLFQGFMGLGLVVGIAALGVIAFRAVVERRQQIGMLRAIGYQRSMVALSFLLESGLVALSGILMGLLMGVSFSWVLWTFGEVDDQASGTFIVPWVQLFVICGIALLASLLMTYFPARAASRVAVAEALRYE
ncbi:MAG: FtsX-like permease family protein [Dehalococcoidia bacterium]|nr:FtsX-like permease family protein [Dehalococcoidia bacterium]MCA9844385.1 FtsX-like permease family protein [Dehalococcoidia bacterium]